MAFYKSIKAFVKNQKIIFFKKTRETQFKVYILNKLFLFTIFTSNCIGQDKAETFRIYYSGQKSEKSAI